MEETGFKKCKFKRRIFYCIISLAIIISLLFVSQTNLYPAAVSAFAQGDNCTECIPTAKISASGQTDFSGKRVLLGGMPFGIKLYTDGILISGTSEVDAAEGNINPGKLAGLKKGDIIKKINGKEAISISDVLSAATESNGDAIKLTIERKGKRFEAEIKPIRSASENAYKLGLWVKDGTAGIGTVTYIDPENNSFGGLGHGVCDADTGELLPMSMGKLSEVTINSIDKGRCGDPGELRGYFSGDENGVIISNTEYGLFGVLNSIDNINTKEIEIASMECVKEGAVKILCTLTSNTICEFDAEIEKINNNPTSTKNFIIKITDPKLLDQTGGIVQGMSGSPVIQNGKLIGAVTHVLVDDPQRGYGIFIENMLQTASESIK